MKQVFLSSIVMMGLGIVIVTHGASPELFIEQRGDASLENKEALFEVVLNAPVPLNVYRGVVRYDPTFFEFKSFDDSRSIINIWRDRPRLVAPGMLLWSGASLTPFMGEHWNIGTIHLIPKKIGNTMIGIEDAAVYHADGKGTEAKLPAVFKSIAVTAVGSSEEGGDTIGLEKSSLMIDSLALAYDPFREEQSLFSFVISGGGLKSYRISVRYRTGLFWSGWEVINELPVVLPRETWEAQVRVENPISRELLLEKSVYRGDVWLLGGAATGGGLLIVLLLINTLRKRRMRYNKGR